MAIDITPTTILAPFEAEHEAVDITRNNKGSAWDRIGNNELIAADKWRYNYNPDTGIFEGRAIMGQWTNEILDPRDMTTGNWSESGVSVARDAVGIDGNSNTANTLTDNSTSFERLEQSVTIADNSNDHIALAYIKKEDDESIFPAIGLFLQGGSTVNNRIYINKKTGSFDFDNSTGSGDVIDAGDFWLAYITLPNNSSGNTTKLIQLIPAASDTLGSPNGDVTGSSIFDVGSTFSNRSTPPPVPVYGETAGQSFTQDPDMGDVSNLDDINYNPDEATFTVEFNSAYSEGTLFDLHSDGNNRIYAHRNSSNEIHLVIVDGATTQADLNLGTIADNTDGKIAVGWKEDDIAGCLDGGTVQMDSSATIPTVDTLHIGRDYNDTNYWDAFIGGKLNYPRKLENSDIQDESR